MRRFGVAILLTAAVTGPALAQDYSGAQNYTGPSSFGAQETLYRYDDQEPWKHGWRKQMSYHEGWHSFRPYNYHHVFGQSQTAATYGQSMPYSQQWWHRYHSVSSQYNHLQGQPPMAMPQYVAPPQTVGMGIPPQGMYGVPPAPMNIDPVYQQPMPSGETPGLPVMPAPLMPVN